jgi:hypothetical protein
LDSFIWGETTRLDLTKKQANELIKKYVDTRYPDRVKKYIATLSQKEKEALRQQKENIYLKGHLMWQDNDAIEDKKLNALEAKFYCKKLRLLQRRDWRVPKYDELLTLINFTNYEPANLTGFNYFVPSKYWTSTKDMEHKKKFWVVDFRYGTTSTQNKELKLNIRCVRTLSKKLGEY